MLDRIVHRLRALRVEAVPFDPGRFEDPLAHATGWGPAKGGGASFRTHRLVEIDPHRAEFKPTRGALLFYGVFLVVGVGMSIFFGYSTLRGSASGAGTFVPLLVGIVFGAAGGAMYWHGAAPIVFDKRRGEYWKGRTAPYESTRSEGPAHFARLDGIHALQLVAEHCRSKDSSYYSYELNLVLSDGSRLNVVDHGDPERLRADAHALGAFLDRPVWDASDAR